MKQLEEWYNNRNFKACASCYTEDCVVTLVNGGASSGQYNGREEVATFLQELAGTHKATNMRFTVTKVDGFCHEDTWAADSGTGSCKAEWAPVQDHPLERSADAHLAELSRNAPGLKQHLAAHFKRVFDEGAKQSPSLSARAADWHIKKDAIKYMPNPKVEADEPDQPALTAGQSPLAAEDTMLAAEEEVCRP